jgi:hypothetical protein
LANTVINTQERFYCDKFDIKLVSSLSLFLYENFSFWTVKDQNEKILAVHSATFPDHSSLLDQLITDEFYQLDIPIKVFVHNTAFSLIPGMLFNNSFLQTYLAFSGDLKDNIGFATPLESNNIQLVGGVDKTLFEKLSNGKSNIEFYHGATAFLSYCFSEKPNFLNQEIFIYLFGNHFYLSGFSKQELVVFNRFEAHTSDDLMKYVFGITHQLKFDRKLCRLTIIGDVNTLSLSKEWGNTYFKNFRILQPKSNLKYHDGPHQIQENPVLESRWEFT